MCLGRKKTDTYVMLIDDEIKEYARYGIERMNMLAHDGLYLSTSR